jgi:hypothetical protein
MTIKEMFNFAHNQEKPVAPSELTCRGPDLLEMSSIEHFSPPETSHYAMVKTKELTLKQILFVPCPTCGAATKEVCELHSGAPRTEPHRDRKLSAAEAVEAKARKQL